MYRLNYKHKEIRVMPEVWRWLQREGSFSVWKPFFLCHQLELIKSCLSHCDIKTRSVGSSLHLTLIEGNKNKLWNHPACSLSSYLVDQFDSTGYTCLEPFGTTKTVKKKLWRSCPVPSCSHAVLCLSVQLPCVSEVPDLLWLPSADIPGISHHHCTR